MSNVESSMSDRLQKVLADLQGDSGQVLGVVNVDLDSSDLRPLWTMKPKISEDEALKILGPRILGESEWDYEAFRPLLQYVLYSMPEDKWSSDLMTNLDVRPFLDQLSQFVDRGGSLPNVKVGAGYGRRTLDSIEFVRAQQGAHEATAKAAQAQFNDGTSQTVSFEYSANAAGLAPEARTARAQSRVANNPNISAEEALGAGPEEIGQVVSRAEIMRAFDISGSNNPLALFDVLEQYRSQGATVPDTIQMGTGGQGEQAGPAVNPMSLEEAMTYLRNSNLAPAQVRALQERLIKSGYMDRIEGAYSWGDITDPVTTRAYQSMVLDMYRNNTSLDETLRQKAIQRAESMPSMRGEMWNATLDQIAQNMIGRNLLASERAQLTATLNQMRAMSQVAPGSQFGVEETDIQSALVAQLPEEVRSVGGADALYRQDQMLKSRWF